jgi:hypothetical protein
VGISELGGNAMFLNANDIQLGRGEPIQDTARVIGRMAHGAVIRTFAQSDVETFAEFSKKLDSRREKAPAHPPKEFWQGRLEDINAFEKHLARNGTRVVKFFLHLSREEQKKRFLNRIDDESRNWKFSSADVRDRAYWNNYHQAYSDILTNTSTPWAPWYIIPADYKYVARLAVAHVLIHELSQLHPRYPKLDKAGRKALAKAKKILEQER